MARFFQLYRATRRINLATRLLLLDQLAWSNSIYVGDTDAKAMQEAKPHLEALANRFLKMPVEMLLLSGYTSPGPREAHPLGQGCRQAAERRRSWSKAGVVIVGGPKHGARKARRISGSRRLQQFANQDPVRHAAERNGARQHDGNRRGNSAALPRSQAATGAEGSRGGSDSFSRRKCVLFS